MSNKETDAYMETYSGRKMYILNPTPKMIHMSDIAHSLSNQCRYTGHCKRFYSVAEHSVIVSKLCSNENKLWGLLHDATESYLTDVSSPVKPHLSNYRELERGIMEAVMEKYGLPKEMPEEVHIADMIALSMEAKELMFSKGKDWVVNEQLKNEVDMTSFEYHIKEDNIEVVGLMPNEAKELFIHTFYEYINE